MAEVEQILWRQVTDADFLCVERSRENTPESGGGQTYFSLSFGVHLDIEDFGRFLGVDPPDQIRVERPNVAHDVAILTEPSVVEQIEFMPRYKSRPDDRYRIARQNRQRSNQRRHPAWTVDRGFPIAPDDISQRDDPRMPDLSQLKVIVVQDQGGAYFADYINADLMPTDAPDRLAPLFVPNADAGPDGLIVLAGDGLSVGKLATIVRCANERPHGFPTAPEIEDARDATARLSGGRSRRGQSFRQSADERLAIDRHAMRRATIDLEAKGWEVHDRSINHPYDLECRKQGERLHVEVKGTTSSGASVLLTPNEVVFAREFHPQTALLIVCGVVLSRNQAGNVVASGGEIDLRLPWDIDAEGSLSPTGFVYELSD